MNKKIIICQQSCMRLRQKVTKCTLGSYIFYCWSPSEELYPKEVTIFQSRFRSLCQQVLNLILLTVVLHDLIHCLVYHLPHPICHLQRVCKISQIMKSYLLFYLDFRVSTLKKLVFYWYLLGLDFLCHTFFSIFHQFRWDKKHYHLSVFHPILFDL